MRKARGGGRSAGIRLAILPRAAEVGRRRRRANRWAFFEEADALAQLAEGALHFVQSDKDPEQCAGERVHHPAAIAGEVFDFGLAASKVRRGHGQ